MDGHGDWLLMRLLACGEDRGSEEPTVNSKCDFCLLTFRCAISILTNSESNS